MEYETEADAPRTDRTYLMYIPIVLVEMIRVSRNEGKITSFHASQVPEISIKSYMERIGKYIGCSNECFVLLLIYVDRIIKMHKDITLSLLCVHRLVITAAMIAAKFLDDVYYSNAFYAKVGGVTTTELNKLEAHFLSLLDYKLYVSPQEYDLYRRCISIAVQKYLHRVEKSKLTIAKSMCTKPTHCKPVSAVKPYNLFNYATSNRTNLQFPKRTGAVPRGRSGDNSTERIYRRDETNGGTHM
ncbi:cyclin, putative (CYC3) [Plasmodium ovale wallikeri]|uniref:Cyclin, putative n=2 Tax=Plasmodium ovale TaxID=36330 RepID=A0A1C3KJK7_PLAOA|nr:cyclin, putative (CYC3) [Plasmodium ovale wallikeri]SBT36642.1 cyclin, putative (CYC3) [Plasmodium ovale wallikeri]SBT74027.1 cyclin, putative [Plasmodium ovale]